MKTNRNCRGACPLMVSVMAWVWFATGCANPVGLTGDLWQRHGFHPATTPNLSLSMDASRKDVLVQYDEQRDKEEAPRRRAYWLFAQPNNTATNQPMPKFVDRAESVGLPRLPVLEEKPQPGNARAAYAVVTPPIFELWLDGTWQGQFRLPRYQNVSCKFGRALLTPLAVSLDIGTLPIQYRD